MMPNDSLRGETGQAPFQWEQPLPSQPLVDYHPGGVGLHDTSMGLQYQLWTAGYDGEGVYVVSEAGERTPLFSREGVLELSLAFDSLMSPFVAFTDAGGSTFWHYREGVPQFFPYLPAGSKNLFCRLDDARPLAQGYNDILVAYLRDGALYHRRQRDNYEQEILLEPSAGSRLVGMGINTGLSMQFRTLP